MRLIRTSSLDASGTWSCGELEVECSRCEQERLCRLAEVFHPELTIVQVTGGHEEAATGDSVAVRVWYPPANRHRLDQLLEGRMDEVIPGLDIGLGPVVG